MRATIEFVFRHGYLVLLGWVFAEQIGFPIPSIPILLAAGALAGTGHLSLPVSLLCCLVAAIVADSLWFQLGRLRGTQVLRLLCRISLEPDSCVRHTQGTFSRHGARTLLFAKFVPGINTVAPPMAGVVGMAPWRFLVFDALGTLLWGGAFLGLGYAFSGEIERVAERVAQAGGWALAVVVLLFFGYAGYKFTARRRFLRELHVARIGADDLKARIDSGENVVIVDMRHTLDIQADPETIPGAFRIAADELEHERDRLPHDREIVLFCT